MNAVRGKGWRRSIRWVRPQTHRCALVNSVPNDTRTPAPCGVAGIRVSPICLVKMHPHQLGVVS